MHQWLRRATQGSLLALASCALFFAPAAVTHAAGWTTQTTGVTWNIEGIAFSDVNTGVAVGANGKTLYTSNGGTSWSAGSTVSGGRTLYDVAWSGTDPIAVGAAGTIAKSADNGATWTTQTSGTTTYLYGISMNDDTGIVVGGSGLILKTTDGGVTWTSKTSGTTQTLWDVRYQSIVGTAIAVGANGTILYSEDDGETWTAATSGVTTTLFGVDFFPTPWGDVTATVVGSEATYLESLNLTTWTSDPTGIASTQPIVDIAINDSALDPIAVADSLVLTSYLLGDDWLQDSIGTGLNALARVLDSDLVWVAGNSGKIYLYQDGDPVVSDVTPITATVGVATTLSVTVDSASSISSCDIYIGEGSATAMTISDDTASVSYTFSSAGAETAFVECEDFYLQNGISATATITVTEAPATDTTAPTVSAITPTTATAGTAATFAVTYSDNVAVTSCTLYIGGVSQGAMTLSSGTASKSYTFSSSGTSNAKATCVDAAGNSTSGAVTSITISAASSSSTDTTAPTVSTITPTTTTAGATVSLNATYSDAVGVTSCNITLDGTTKAMSLSGATATYVANFTTSGTYTVTVSCADAAGNAGTSSTSVIVAAASTDTTGPTVSTVTPITATQNTAATFTVTATDSSGMNSCHLFVDSNDQGAMTAGSSDTYSRSYTFSSSGSHTAYASCGDAAGNLTTGTSTTITVAAAASSGTDTTAPTVGAISPSTATEDTAVTLQASVSDSVGVATCTLYVNSVNAGSMTISGGYATASYTFTAAGTGIANAYCTDAAGNATRGASTYITIAAAEEVAADEAEPGSLIKLACSSDSDVNDPCRAVYFYAEQDGKRHAFPNEKVYFGWYNNFDDVIVVTDDFMASLTLGGNVTYKPGVTMVKFITVNTVYAVGEYGELRAIDSEDTASSIWGTDWNTQIHDISDAFYSNYEFGEDIDSTSDYDPDAVEAVIDTIDELLAVR